VALASSLRTRSISSCCFLPCHTQSAVLLCPTQKNVSPVNFGRPPVEGTLAFLDPYSQGTCFCVLSSLLASGLRSPVVLLLFHATLKLRTTTMTVVRNVYTGTSVQYNISRCLKFCLHTKFYINRRSGFRYLPPDG
jgi:hypothetical protein